MVYFIRGYIIYRGNKYDGENRYSYASSRSTAIGINRRVETGKRDKQRRDTEHVFPDSKTV